MSTKRGSVALSRFSESSSLTLVEEGGGDGSGEGWQQTETKRKRMKLRSERKQRRKDVVRMKGAMSKEEERLREEFARMGRVIL